MYHPLAAAAYDFRQLYLLLVLAVLPCISHPVHLVANLQHVSHSSLDNLSIVSAHTIIAACDVINNCHDEALLPPDN